jgi:L,D-transpeptidase ErfK/SrfK
MLTRSNFVCFFVLSCVSVALLFRAAAAREFALRPGQAAVGRVSRVVAQPGETVADIARRFDLGFTEVMAANPDLDPDAVIAGARVTLPGFHLLPDGPHRGLVVNLAAQRLFYFPDPAHVVTFPIGVALAGHETPLGETTIVDKQRDPVWRPTATIRADQPWLPDAIGPGEANPLGTAALYLGWPAYLIHGTNRPDGIGRSGSYGCLSLYPEDIRMLYAAVPRGTPVRVLRQNVAAAWIDGRLVAQIYPNEEQGRRLQPISAVSRAVTADLRARLQGLAAAHHVTVDWAQVEAARWDRTGLPVHAAR